MPTHYQGNPREVRALDTFIKLTRAAESCNARIHQKRTTDGLSPSQFAVLEALYHLGPLSPGQISAKVLKSTGNITLVLNNLERQGLVMRERSSADRRSIIIHLTDAGRVAVRDVLPGHVSAIVAEMSILTVEEQQTLADICKKLGLGASNA